MFIVAPTWGLDASDLAQFIAPLHPSLKGIGVKGNHHSAESSSPHKVGVYEKENERRCRFIVHMAD